MTPSYVSLEWSQVALAALLMGVNGVLSLLLRLDLERRLAIASLRMVVQLGLLGLILEWVFSREHPVSVLALMGVMGTAAGLSAVGRSRWRYPGIRVDATVGVMGSGLLLTLIALGAILRIRPLLEAQYAIPVLGMILGNSLTGISLGLDRLGESLHSGRDRVHGALAMGASRWEAALPALREAAVTGMVPILNSMMVVGIVSLPGMMTGQLLAGVAPLEAIKYQIVILFLIGAATALGIVLVMLLGFRRLFSDQHQFLECRLREAP